LATPERVKKFKMNTLSVLDANTSNISEGLYLELTNALKKDFENDSVDKARELELRLCGFNWEDQQDPEDNLTLLKDYTNDYQLIKKVFDDYHYDDYRTSYTWDIDDNKITSFDICERCKVKVMSCYINSYTDICFECEPVQCNFCKKKVDSDEGLSQCRHCKSVICTHCYHSPDGCAVCVLQHFTKSLSSYATPYIPLLNYIPKIDTDDYLEYIMSASFTKILNIRF